MIDTGSYYLTRIVFQKALALVYLIGFLIIVHQFKPLLGEKGLLPVPQFIKLVSFSKFPSLFFFIPRDWAFTLFGLLGVGISLFTLIGFSEKCGLFVHMLSWFLMWVIYLSFVNVGQTFYSFGWESMLLETGFLAIFLGDASSKVPVLIIYLIRLVLFKDMLGAGLIKIRGDSCWKDLTCLNFHYETQPMPNPLSWFFHHQPEWFHKLGVLYNHFEELIVPFGFFMFQPIATIAGLFTLFFHGMLTLSGNFAFLSFLSAVLTISTFSDSFLSKIIPLSAPAALTFTTFHSGSVILVGILVGVLSIRPILNMISPNQVMNTSFDPFHLVNTYGAFGTITKTRNEVVIEGTNDDVITDSTKWKEYEFIGKPGKLNRLPAQIAPYHLRLDWLMWFASFNDMAQDPWFFHLMQKLLQGDSTILALLKFNPFPDKPPAFIRAQLYKYNFTTQEERKKTGNWWKREPVGDYFPTVSLDTTEFKSILNQLGW